MNTQLNGTVTISVVIPLLNEQDNVVSLYHELKETMSSDSRQWELIFVDDGSNDMTLSRLRQCSAHDPCVTIIEFTRRFGQTAALSAGFSHARGHIIVPLDGDGQNDPHDIPRLVDKLDDSSGWDVVSGWRKQRKDDLLSRRVPSAIANWLVRRMTWTQELHDFGCSIKAYHRDALSDVRLYGEMHRFLPALCKWRGARITEMPVNHRPRVNGKSKYGLKRTVKVLLDLVTIKFLGDYLTKPIYFFGKLAIMSMATSLMSLGIALLQRFGLLTLHSQPIHLNNNILVLMSMMLCLMSIMFIMLGVISELLVRIYHESQDVTPYKVRRVLTSQYPDHSEILHMNHNSAMAWPPLTSDLSDCDSSPDNTHYQDRHSSNQ